MLDRNKDAQSAVLNDLQNEIKSLKSLLLSRRSTGSSLIDQISNNNNNNISAATATPSTNGNTATVTSSPTSTSTVPNTEGLSPRLSAAFNTSTRPGIPAWQLSSANKATETKNETTSK